MEYASIEREIFAEGSPEVVFEVISRPEHLREWWLAPGQMYAAGLTPS